MLMWGRPPLGRPSNAARLVLLKADRYQADTHSATAPSFVRCARLRRKMPRMAQKWVKKFAASLLWTTTLPESATACVSRARLRGTVSATRSFFSQNSQLIAARDGSAIAHTHSSHAHSCVLPRLRNEVCSEIRTDLPNQFRKAFCCCKRLMFLYIEGYRPLPVECWPCFGAFAVCRVAFRETCALERAFWPCNRIHRNGG